MKKLFLILPVLGFLFFLPKPVFAATMALSPASGTHNVGDTFTVDIVVDPVTDTMVGASAIIDYDNSKLTATSVTQGGLFSGTPLTNTIGTSATDPTQGEIHYDAGTLSTSGITTKGIMATITFRAIAAGTASVRFVFDPSATTGTSQVAPVGSPTNVLTGISQGSYTIVSSGASNNGSTSLPNTGAVENTIALITGGLIFLGLCAKLAFF